MNASRSGLAIALLRQAPLLLLGLVAVLFGLLSPRFWEWQTLQNILVQSCSTTIVATGMTFVLLTAGVDLSAGAIMFVCGAVAGTMAVAGLSLWLIAPAVVLTGAICGCFNAAVITGLGVMAFIATLASQFLGRGFALWMTGTRAMNLPDGFLQIGTARWLGVPMPIWITAAVVVIGHVVLTRTPFGRQVHALGENAEAARKAGVGVRPRLAAVYVISGFCAGLGGLVALAQLGSVSPTFGDRKEFTAIAAAVLGGTSLFGGRGHVLPGTLIGAVLIQTVETGLNMINANPYLYPLVISGIIFLAVLIDSLRTRLLTRWRRRMIRSEEARNPA